MLELDNLLSCVKACDELQLNDEQTDVFTKITQDSFHKLLVCAEAGAGKTFVLTHAAAELYRQERKIVLCAPTHLARLALLQKMPADVQPFIETRTIASLLSQFGFATADGGTGFSRPKIDRVNAYEFIFIDECSMLGEAEYNLLMDSTAKIVFSGDFKQLPAILKKNSGMLDDPRLERMVLSQQMRAPGVIHDIASRNREEVFFPTESVYDQNSKVVVHGSKAELLSRMADDILIDPRGVAAHPHYRFITHSNAEMYAVGMAIRDQVTNSPKPVVPGEYMLSYEGSPAAYNGEVVRVLNVTADPSASHKSLWTSYKLQIDGSRGICWVNVINPKQLPAAKQYLEQLRELLKEANRRKAFDASKGYFAEIKHIEDYYTELFYPFSMTTHKSQGQTIEHTYVDTESFAKASNKRALLYVGLSRASVALHTVKVEPTEKQKNREINARYRAAKLRYVELFNKPVVKLRERTGLKAQTPAQKLILAEYLEALIADAEQGA